MIDPIKGRAGVARAGSAELRPVKRVQRTPAVTVQLSREAEAYLDEEPEEGDSHDASERSDG